VEDVLRALYKLQQIDNELDELDEDGGDLPEDVEGLEKQLEGLNTAIEAEEEKLRELRRTRAGSNDTITELRERIRDLNERLRTVRNNKEYEATTNDIASAEEELQNIERGMSAFDTEEANYMKEIELLGRQRDEATTELEEKKGTLATLHETHGAEIEELRANRETVLGQIEKNLLDIYDYIRSAHSDAVVKVRKGACSGCYRAITPQTLVEMRRNDQMFRCEHCGRILVDEEIADSVSIL
jgi:predicted  nucleic acid-binding Zn-ribbon protein